jgi:hypothetical protein
VRGIGVTIRIESGTPFAAKLVGEVQDEKTG